MVWNEGDEGGAGGGLRALKSNLLHCHLISDILHMIMPYADIHVRKALDVTMHAFPLAMRHDCVTVTQMRLQ